MSKESLLTKQEKIENKFSRIRKGTHWFKVIGGIFYFIGWLSLFLVVLTTGLAAIDGKADFSEFFDYMISIVFTLVFGWCFMLMSECMEAVDYIFKETKDVV